MTKNIDRLRIDLLRFTAGRTRLLLQKMIHEQRHIFQTLAQRWNFDRNNRQPIIKIFAESAVLHFPLERFVRRADDADIHRDALVVAHAAHFALLQHAKQFRLQRRRHRIHFIEENRAEICFFE